MEFLKKFDAFPKTYDEFRDRTVPGAIVSIISVILMCILFFSELRYYMRTEKVDHMFVNTTQAENLRVTFDVSFHEIPCSLIALDIYDDLGVPVRGLHNEVYKHKLEPGEAKKKVKGIPFFNSLAFLNSDKFKDKGEKQALGDGIKSEEELENLLKEALKNKNEPPNNFNADCGNCYGAGNPGQCCQTCTEVKDAYVKKGWRFNPQGIVQCRRETALDNLKSEKAQDGGCQIYGLMDLDTTAGHFHIAPHKEAHKESAETKSVLTLLDFISFTFDSWNVSHTINHLTFGNHFPGIKSPLNNQLRVIEDTHGMYQYYLKVVPTTYKYLNGKIVQSNQYSVTEHMRHLSPGSGKGVPGVYFNYEVAPIQSMVEERRSMTFTGFLTSVCAIVGGTYTVLGILHGVVITAVNIFSKSILDM